MALRNTISLQERQGIVTTTRGICSGEMVDTVDKFRRHLIDTSPSLASALSFLLITLAGSLTTPR